MKRQSVFSGVYRILALTIFATAAFAGIAFVAQLRLGSGRAVTARVYFRSQSGEEGSTDPDGTFLRAARQLDESGALGIGRIGRIPFLAVRPNGAFILLYGAPLLNPRRLAVIVAGIFIALSGIALAARFAMREVLSPLSRLGEGVSAIRNGNLAHRVEETGAEEFAGLAASFNAMADMVARQLETKERLLLDLSHEMRSPLTRMALAAEFIEDGETRQGIRDDVLELERKIARIMEASRLDTPYGEPKPERIAPGKFLAEAVAKFGPTDPPVAVSGFATIPDTNPERTFEADPSLLGTVVRNLLENAVRYSGPGTEPVELSLHREERTVIIEVRDHGPGVSEAEAERLFEPFRRGDRAKTADGGYGIGLYLCRKIVEAHGGRIRLENAPGGGALATVELPQNVSGDEARNS